MITRTLEFKLWSVKDKVENLARNNACNIDKSRYIHNVNKNGENQCSWLLWEGI